MYRRAVMEEDQAVQDQFITRLGSLPVVNSAWTQACDLYLKARERNALLKATCSLAEGSVKTLTATAKPIVNKCQPQIEQVNAYACQQLARLEENYPIITRPTDQLVQEGKEILKPVTDRVNAIRQYSTDTYNKGKERVDAVKQLGVDTVTSVKDYGMDTVAKTMETPYGKFVAEKVDDALTMSEEYVEKYLPDSDDGEEEEEDDEEEGEDTPANPITRVTTLSTKVRQRMYKRAMKDLKGLQLRSQETLSKLNFTVDLIQYAKGNMEGAKDRLEDAYHTAQKKVVDTWHEINKDEDEEEDEEGSEDIPPTFEGQTIAIARRLTRQLKHGVATFTAYLPESVQPEVLKEKITQAKKYSEDLYNSFRDAAKYDDLPTLLLSQTKEKLAYVQETLGFITEKFLMVPVNWLIPPSKGVEPLEGTEKME